MQFFRGDNKEKIVYKEKKIKCITIYTKTLLTRYDSNLYNVVEIPFNKGINLQDITPTHNTYVLHREYLPNINGLIYMPLWYNERVDEFYVFKSIATDSMEIIERKLSIAEWKDKILSALNISHMEIVFDGIKKE